MLSLYMSAQFWVKLFCAEVLLVSCLKRRQYWPLTLLAGFILCLCLSVLWPHSGFLPLSILRYIVIFLVSVLFLWRSCQVSLSNAFFFGIGAYGVQHLAYNAHSLVMHFTQSADIVVYSGPYFAVLVAVYLAVYAALYFIFFRRVKIEETLIVSRTKLVFVVVMFLAIVIGLNNTLLQFSLGIDSPLVPVCHLYAMCCCILFLSIQFDLFEQNKLREEKLLLNNLLNLKEEQKQRSEESIEIINMKCHDLKHQFERLRQMKSTDMDRAIEEAESAISFYDSAVDTGCVALNIVITEKSLRNQTYKIKFDYLIDGESLAFMEDIDIYTLFGNALDNAIESVMNEEEDKRVIHLEIRRKDHFLCVKMENYCSRQVVFRDGLPVTSKGDSAWHGIGTRSMGYIVKKYHGTLKMNQESCSFVLSMVFSV